MNYRLCGYGGALLAVCIGMAIAPRSVAQSIMPANDGTGTEVRQVDGRFDIDGGQRSQDGRNLFHSFEQFGLDEAQIANFLSQSQIENILGRVVGGNPSIIQGMLQVSGGSSNLYLMNPAGIVFGETASLNVPASFTATTSDRVDFAEGWWMIGETPVDQDLAGDPTAFRFGPESSGAIVNAATLQVLPGENLTLLGGTVVSTGRLIAPGGTITLATVPGGHGVRMSQPGQVLSLEIQPMGEGEITEVPEIAIASLPQLLTRADIGHAQGVTVAEDGTVYLNGSGVAIAEGDLAVQQLAAQDAILSSARTIALVESELITDGDLSLRATDTLTLRDSVTTPLVIQAGGDLTFQGDRSVDILALNHPAFPLQSGGLFQLISDGVISTDAHFVSGGAFSILDLSGQPASFVSLYDPIISADGDVQFGDYTGAALLVEATGSIEGGTITITQPDLTYSVLPDWEIVGVGRVEFSNYDAANANTVPAQVVITTRDLNGANGLNNTRVPAADLEAFLELGAGDLSSLGNGAAVDGSGMRTTVTVAAGDVIRLNWQFFSNELNDLLPGTNNFAVVSLSGPDVVVTELVNTDFPGGFPLNSMEVNQALDNFRSSVAEVFGALPQTVEIPVAVAGTYTLGIAVINADAVESATLLVDSITPNPITIDDRSLLASSPALILRAGVETLQYAPNIPQIDVPTVPTDFTSPDTTTSPASIRVGDINTEFFSSDGMRRGGGPVVLAAPGDIQVGSITTGGEFEDTEVGGFVSLTAGQDIEVVTIDTSGFDGGDVTIRAGGTFRATGIFLSDDFDFDPSNDAINSGPGDGSTIPARQIPTSINATAFAGGATITIEHGGREFLVGPMFERDFDGRVVYVNDAGNVVTYLNAEGAINRDPEGRVVFTDADGNETLDATPLYAFLDVDELSDDVSYTAGAITSNQANAGAVTSFRDRPFLTDESVSLGDGRIQVLSNYTPPDIPGGETPGGETPGGETPGGETPGGEIPGSETPGSETPGGETPGGEIPGGEIPGGETPGGETPGGETPGGETPGGETPGGEIPGGETPGSETPGGETPGGETPGGETPGGDSGVDRPRPNETLANDPCSANSLLAFQVSNDAILELDDSIVAELQTSRAGQNALCNQPEPSRSDRVRSPSQDESQPRAVPNPGESDRQIEPPQVDQPEVQI